MTCGLIPSPPVNAGCLREIVNYEYTERPRTRLVMNSTARRVFIKGIDLHKVNNDPLCTLHSMASSCVRNALLHAKTAKDDVTAVPNA